MKRTNTIPSKRRGRLQKAFIPRNKLGYEKDCVSGHPLTWYGQEVVNGSYVIDGVGQHADLPLPLLLEELHVFLSQLALGFSSQSQGGINDLQNTSGFLKHVLISTERFFMFIQWTQQQTKQV